MPDLEGETMPDSSVINKHVRKTPLLETWNGFRAQYIYPSEITSCETKQAATSKYTDGKSSPPHDDNPTDFVGKEKLENQQLSTDALRKSSGLKKYKCDECQRSFSTSATLRKHKHPRKEFACKHCDKTYVSLGALKMHIRTHTLPCKCTICGKAFSRPWLLQGHIRTHTGEKPYQCPTCQRAFADRSNLRAHLQTHSAVKKYCCSQCSRSFSRMSLLLKHQYTCGNEL